MAKKSIPALLLELPDLIKISNDIQIDKNVGLIGIYEMTLDIIESILIRDGGIPVGGIINWSGSLTNIPNHWTICDGTRGTPNLRDRFILGSGGSYSPNIRGGLSSHTHSGNADNHKLTANELPKHKHSLGNLYVQSDGGESGSDSNSIHFDGTDDVQTSTFTRFTEDNASLELGHNHTLNILSSNSLPPYYSLAFIMFQGIGYTNGIQIHITSLNRSTKELFFTITGGTIVNGLNIQYSINGTTWTSLGSDTTSPKNISAFNPINGSFFRLQSLDDLSNYSNDIQYMKPHYSSGYSSGYFK